MALSKRHTQLGRLGRGTADRVQVRSRGSFAVGSVVWRDALGALVCTVVAKATYELAPGECTLLKDPLPIQHDDAHWDRDPGASVQVPSDLAPFKKAAEVVVVGSAFAPAERAVQRVVARVVVGSIDKGIEVWGPRWFRADGSVEGATRKARFPLRYEHAAGGRDSDNPVGIDVGVPDEMGRRRIPEVVPHLHELVSPSDYIPTVGFGPIASSWRSREASLTEHGRAWIRRAADSPLPRDFPAQFFQAAPVDQWLDRPFAPNERLILEGLHPEIPRLVTNFPAVEPRVLLADGGAEPLRLQADLLVIDTDRSLATLTFRGQVALAGGVLRAIVVDAAMGAELRPEAVRQMLDAEGSFRLGAPSLKVTMVPVNRPPAFSGEQTGEHVPMSTAQALPFTAQALPFTAPSTPARSTSSPPEDSALPFRRASPSVPPPRHAAIPVPPASASPSTMRPPPLPVPSSPGTPAPPRPPSVPVQPGLGMMVGAPMIPPAPPQPPAAVPMPPAAVPMPPASVPGSPAPAPSAPGGMSPAPIAPPGPVLPPAPVSASASPSWSPSPVAPPPPVSRPAASTSRSSFDAAFGSAKAIEPAVGNGKQAEVVSRGGAPGDLAPGTRKSTDAAFSAKSASDAAAQQDRSQQGTLHGGALQPAKPTLRRLAVVDLLSFEPAVVPRLRSMPRFAEVFAPRTRARAVQGVDEARNEPPPRDRTDVLRVLSCARPSEASALRRALAEGLDDVDDFDLPLLLVAGELRPSFDEVEMLRATVSVTQSIAGTDKRILSAVALGQEALAASLLPRPEIATGLCRQIEQAASTPAFPPRYVAAQVERLLLEERKYKRRTLLGASRVRAELALPGGGEPWLLYVPDAAAASLPLLLTFPVIALCEVRPREDVAETHPEALFAAALGRVLHGRAEG